MRLRALQIYIFITAISAGCVLTLLSSSAKSAISESGSAVGRLELFVGEQKVLGSSGSHAVVSHSQIVKVFSIKSKLMLAAKKPGEADITLSSSRGTEHIHVVCAKSSLKGLYEELLRLVEGVPSLELHVNPDSLEVSGHILRLDDWHELHHLKEIWGRQIVLKTTTSDDLNSRIKERLEDEIQNRSLASVEVIDGKQVGVEPTLLVTSRDRHEIAEAKKMGVDWGVSVEENNSLVELVPMIEIEILIAEVKKNFIKSLGLKTPGSYSATILPADNFMSATTQFAPMNFELHAAVEKNAGRILANPKLLCRSGEVAHFLAGGEIPIKMMSWKTADVIWKKYGVILDITPKADFHDGISTKISTEISLLDETHKVEGIPGFLTNRIETHFNLKGSKTIALSGLIKNEQARHGDGVPVLSDIPILGDLFKSKEFRDQHSELVVFVTPRIISAANPPAPPPAPLWVDED